MRKNNLQENEKHLELLGNTLNLECDIHNDKLINPLLKKLSPFLRYLEKEIEELEKFDDIKKIKDELEEIINLNQQNLDDYIPIELKPKKLIKVKKSIDNDFNDNYIRKHIKRLI
jgi:hypothetical protein